MSQLRSGNLCSIFRNTGLTRDKITPPAHQSCSVRAGAPCSQVGMMWGWMGGGAGGLTGGKGGRDALSLRAWREQDGQ